MQRRHQDRQQYFNELANTSRTYYIDYLKPYLTLTPQTRVLEIGCGEGGNLLPFAEAGCRVKGIDLNDLRIEQAQQFFAAAGLQGLFVNENFITADKPTTEDERFDLILIHDVVEHIEQPYKQDFFSHISPFLKCDGIIFIGFPAWQMPFGGHQQICHGFVSKIPFIHLLPTPLYTSLLKLSGERERDIQELLSIKRSAMTIEHFEQLCRTTGYTLIKKTLWFINPHYEQKFNLKPRRLPKLLGQIPWFRNFYTTSAFYLLKVKR
jgi:SAM-dependent methyltransferase